MPSSKLKFVVALYLLSVMSLLSGAQENKSPGKWVSAWSAAVHSPLPFPGLPPTPVFDNQTIRMVIRPTLAGQRLRVRFSNAYGSSALEVGSAHVALLAQGSSIVPSSDHALTFNGQTSVKVPIGAPVLSDPIEMQVPAFADVAVTIYVPHASSATSTHFWAQHDTYVSGPGDFSAKTDFPGSTTSTSWYWLADLEVWAGERAGAVVALGDSITDGVGAKQGTYGDWPDLLARRLETKGAAAALAVLNEGIGGNRILYDGAGINALARFDRDVLAQPGVSYLIVLEGINDIGWPHMKPPPSTGTQPKESPFAGQTVTASDLIAGLRQIVDRAHEHHIKVLGATLTPYQGADYFSPDGEQIRTMLNQWIRTSGTFDGVVDFDAAVRDPAHPSQFREDYQSGDHLHPSAAGYKAMADAIDLTALQGSLQ